MSAAVISASGWAIVSVNLVFMTIDSCISIALVAEVSGYEVASSLVSLLGDGNSEINKNQ